ncbi:hypothetical protein [Akkermansia sp. NBRC 115031]|uniref:hypothetical protein n=1 Tax=Akkermansia sp. NBRC 115031 TaxID=2994522 RepID=UPI00255359BC|nr:hypothetical protein [Akkermansia sp. NBRC 115031]
MNLVVSVEIDGSSGIDGSSVYIGRVIQENDVVIVFKCKIISCSSVNSASGMTSVIGFKEDISEIVFKRQLQRSALYCSPSACCSVVDKSDGAFVIQEFRLSFGTIGPGSSYRNGSTTSIDVVIEKFYGFVILKR